MLGFWPENYDRFPVDVDGYWHIAGNIWAGNGYAVGPEPTPTAYRPPTYPLFLAGVRGLTGDRPVLALASQAALDAVTLIAIYFLAMVITGARPVAYLASFLWAVYLPEAASITRFWSEPLCALILTSALLVFMLARKQDKLWQYGVSGLMLGAAALTRPEFFLLPLMFAVLVLVKRGEGIGGRALRASLVLFGCVALLAPWILRNALVFDDFIPATTVGGFVFFVGNATLDEDNYLYHRGTAYGLIKLEGRAPQPLWINAQVSAQMPRSEMGLDRLYAKAAWRLIRDYPGRFIKLSCIRAVRLWLSVGFGRYPHWKSLFVAGINSGLLLLGFIGWLTARHRSEGKLTPLVVVLVYGTLVHMPIEALVRHVFPMIPTLVVLSALGVVAIHQSRAWPSVIGHGGPSTQP